MINSIYDLMGQDVSPPVDESAKNKHIENVLKVRDVCEQIWNIL